MLRWCVFSVLLSLTPSHNPTVSVTPGYCATNLNAYSGHKTADAGGEIITRAALDHDGPTGRFFGEEGEELW